MMAAPLKPLAAEGSAVVEKSLDGDGIRKALSVSGPE